MNQDAARNDALHFLDSAIDAALRSGASPEDVCRTMDFASSKFHASKERRKPKSHVISSRVFSLGLLVCAVLIAISNVFTSYSFSSSITSAILDQRALHNNVPSNDFGTTVQITRNKKKSRPRRIIDLHTSHIDFQKAVLGVDGNHTNYPCPLDSFFHDGCETRNGGTVCVYPNAILKKVKKKYMADELDAFALLNDTRYFPKLYYADEKCQTILVENVRQKGKTKNRWCSNSTYYEDFYKSAFDIFNEKNIIPQDLNTCCNTIVNGDTIRIIDFGQYRLNKEPEKVLETNKKLLKTILKDIPTRIEETERKCRREASLDPQDLDSTSKDSEISSE
mmetsp:Transcript_7337/g.17943  ORF Transcript_7337/g.17943 Transcript_7337/m.17943 type:complete len:336 (+) Transcript_7337:99-1106(+)